jgi:AcrR family transcriptional regulator
MPTYHHGSLRSAILESAARMVEKEGTGGLSVREAARRAGVSHNAPYRHFRDRDALLNALAVDGVARLLKDLGTTSGRELAETYVRFSLARPRLFRLMFAGRRWPEIEARFAEAFADVGRPGAAAAWALVHGLACLILDGNIERDEAVWTRVIGAMRFAVAQRSA